MLCDSVPWGYHVWVGNEKACRQYTRVKELSQGLSNFSENATALHLVYFSLPHYCCTAEEMLCDRGWASRQHEAHGLVALPYDQLQGVD